MILTSSVLLLGGMTARAQTPPSPSPAIAAKPADAAVPAAVASLRFAAALSHTLYDRHNPTRLSLRIDLAGTSAAATGRPPLNLAIVIDRSGSMAEDKKFEYALRAAALVFESLTERDIISLVAFDERATVLSPAGPAVNRAFLDHRLADISPVGWTNLSAGLMEGFAQIDSRAVEGQTKRVLVLTDGMANRGVTAPDGLERLVGAAKARGISVSTMGVGTKFDETLLKALAAAGGGRYAYAATGEDIPKAMAVEVDGLLRMVAQNASIRVRVAGGKIALVHGRLIETPVTEFTLEIGDVREAERAVFVMEIEPDAFTSGAEVSVQAQLTLDDVERAERAIVAAAAKAAHSGDAAAIRAGESPSVILYCGILDALEKAEDAVLGLDEPRFREASMLFDIQHDQARAYALEARDQDLLSHAFLLKHMMADLASARAAGLLHGHDAARKALPKTIDYQRYLREHHR
ncbi:MAG: VWA domain-containing protein [Planctomycetota bacterium]